MEVDSKIIEIIWVRHSISEFNEQMSNFEASSHYLDSKTWITQRDKIKFSIENINSKLSVKGIELISRISDASDYQEHLKQIINGVEKVYLSPLKRCVDTYKIFNKSIQSEIREHFEKLPVQIHPLLYEKIEDSCDICEEITDEYVIVDTDKPIQLNFQYMHARDYLNCEVSEYSFSNYGCIFSELTKEVAEYDNILRELILQNCSENYKSYMVKLMMLLDTKGIVLENQNSLNSRIDSFKKYLNKQTYKKILVFSHENFIKAFINIASHESVENFEFVTFKYIK